MDDIDIAIDSILKCAGESIAKYSTTIYPYQSRAVDNMRIIMRGAINNECAKRLSMINEIVHEIAMAAYDEGVEAGIAWDPDAKEGFRGITPLTPEQGLAYSRWHFCEHGGAIVSTDFSKALQKLRNNLFGLHIPPAEPCT